MGQLTVYIHSAFVEEGVLAPETGKGPLSDRSIVLVLGTGGERGQGVWFLSLDGLAGKRVTLGLAWPCQQEKSSMETALK